jgi:hypothetical protein
MDTTEVCTLPPASVLLTLTSCFQDETRNIFDAMPSLAPPQRSDLHDELTAYLRSDPELIKDVLGWWYEKREVYPTLSRMARDYLSIPGKFLQFLFSLVIQTDPYFIFKQHLSMLNGPSVKAVFSSPTSVAGYQSSRLEHSCALDPGVRQIW